MHFIERPDKPKTDIFNVKDILTQTPRSDPVVNKEIPGESLVAIHTLINSYKTENNKEHIGFNILGVQVLLTPTTADW